MNPPDTPAATAATALRRWSRRLLWLLVALLALWLAAWLAVPPLLKWQLQKQASEVLGRTVTVDAVDFKPWSMELSLEGLAIAKADGSGPQFALKRLYANAEMQSVLRLAPVIDALSIEGPRLWLRHEGEGRLDIADILKRLDKPDEPPSEMPRFSVFNISIRDGEIEAIDAPVATTHRLRALRLDIPFLSNLGARREVMTEPLLSFDLNGDAFRFAASSTPFSKDHKTALAIDLPRLSLAPYLAYWPGRWPLRPTAGELQLALKLAFEQTDAPRVTLSGKAELQGLRVVEKTQAGEAPELASLKSLSVELEDSELLARRVQLGRLQLVEPQLAVRRDARGMVNLQRVADGFAPPAAVKAAGAASAKPADTEPGATRPGWTLGLRDFALVGGRIDWADMAVAPAVRQAVAELGIKATGLAWPATQAIPWQAGAVVAGAPLRLEGQANARSVEGKFALQGLQLGVAAPYLSALLKPRLAGELATEGTVSWKAGADGQADALALVLERFNWKGMQLGEARAPAASWKQLQLLGARVDLARQRVELRSLEIDQPVVHVERDKDGRWMFEDWLRAQPSTTGTPTPTPTVASAGAPGAAKAAAGKTPAAAAPWTVELGELRLKAGGGSLTDRVPAEDVAFTIDGLDLRLRQIRPMAAQPAPMPLALKLELREAGQRSGEPAAVALEGTLTLPRLAGVAPPASAKGRTADTAAPKADDTQVALKLSAERLPLHAVEPYLRDRLNLELQRADLSLRGQLEARLAPSGLSLRLGADAALEDLRTSTTQPAEELLQWKSLNLRGLQVEVADGALKRLRVDETALSDYYARVIIDAKGRINLQDLVKSAPATASGTATPPAVSPATSATAATTTTAAPAAEGPEISFGPIALVNGRVNYADRFIQPNYAANLSELSGGLGSFSNRAPDGGSGVAMAAVSLRGRAEGTATLEITGQLNPLAQPLALDLKGKVRELELPPLSPYSAKYAGYGIERGKLSMDVAYRIAPDGKLEASNQIILNQLAFGDRVPGSDAPNLPVKLAVALLSDSKGVIDINLPISGSINDPQFKLWPIIFKVIGNLIAKAVTAPFSLLASALGGGDELSQVGFAAGSTALDAASRQRLDTVAKALGNRPALQLTVVGQSDLEAEQAAFRRAKLDQMVLAEKRRQLARAGKPAEAGVAVAAAEYPALLKEVYKRADITKPRNMVGLAKDIPQADMEALLMASVAVSSDAMRELALARGLAIKDYLVSKSVATERLFLATPVTQRDGAAWSPRAELKLAAR